MIQKKFNLIKENKPSLTDTYMRQLFKRHPDLFLKSFGSMEGKIWYLKRAMNLQMQKEKAFPLLLHYSYTDVIWPRCEAVKKFELKREFDLGQVLMGSDQDFCDKFGVELSELRKLKSQKPHLEEFDRLWVYSPEK